MNFFTALLEAKTGHRIFDRATCSLEEDDVPDSVQYEFDSGSDQLVGVISRTALPVTPDVVTADWGVVHMYDTCDSSDVKSCINAGKTVEMETCMGWVKMKLVDNVLTFEDDSMALPFRVKRS